MSNARLVTRWVGIGLFAAVAAAAAASAGTVWVPVVTHGSGLHGSAWRSDVALLNAGAAAASVELRLHVDGGVVSDTLALPPGGQSLLADIVAQLGTTGSGALEIVSDQPIEVTARTYDDSGGGTSGQDVPAVTPDQGLVAGQSAWLPQLREDAGYRTNIGLTNTSSGPALVAVELHDGTGTLLASYDVSLDPGQWAQENRPLAGHAGRSDLASGYAKVTVTSGSGVIGYASLVDNVSNDPTTIPLLQTNSGPVAWIPVVSHAQGLGGSSWRSDVGLLNIGATIANVRLRLHLGGNIVSGTTQLPPAAQSILTDVVAQLGASGSGAIEVLSDQPIEVTSRTYNQSLSGTSGQHYAAATVDQGLAAGQSAFLPALAEDAAYRSNVALTNTGATPAAVTVELHDDTGALLSSYDVNLNPGQWAQETRPFVHRAGRTNLASGYAKVTPQTPVRA